MTILGIETSCDETAAALLEDRRGNVRILKSVVASQIKIHEQYGGVVPEVAARNHLTTILPVIVKTLGAKKPDVIAVTAGPGLITSLLVGVQTARTLSYIWKKPLVAVNHVEGHLYANFIGAPSTIHYPPSKVFPAVVLIVSGGHTELVRMKGHGEYELLGRTRDDAAGEAFDKGAKVLGLGYPGGPAIAKAAESGNSEKHDFPRPLLTSGDSDFSFSGLKTSLLYRVRDMRAAGTRMTKKTISDLAASYQQAIVDVLVAKTARAAREHSVKVVLGCGGVMANALLRQELGKKLSQQGASLSVPPSSLCTDNAVMIAAVGAFKARRQEFTAWSAIKARSQWEIVS